MLKRFWKKNSTESFARNTSGNIKILTAFMAVPMMLGVGAAVDTAEIYRARVNFQSAVDAAALQAAKTISRGGTDAEASTAGRNLFDENIKNLAPSVGTISFNTNGGDCSSHGIVANATLRHRAYFDGIHKAFTSDGDKDHSNLKASSTVQCGNDTVEVALVLDNSGSMGSRNKIGTLRSASALLVNTLHNSMASSLKPDPVKFSLIPFSATVNVGSSNKSKSWMDKNGLSSAHFESEFFNFDLDPGVVKVGNVWKTVTGNQTVSRFTLYDNISNVSWSGCVEERPYPYHTNDDTPTTSNPDTLFVPSFAPDTPDRWTGLREQVPQVQSNLPHCIKFNRRASRGIYWCKKWNDGRRGRYHPQVGNIHKHSTGYNNGVYQGGGSGTTTYVDGSTISEKYYRNNYLKDEHNYPTPYPDGKHWRDPSNTGSGTDQQKRQSWTWKYFRDSSGNRPYARDVNSNRNNLPYAAGTGGPNNQCTTSALTDLTSSRSRVITAINAMRATGYTNIQQGIAWGWRTLSPGEPFTQGRSYTSKDNKKIMIVMTDGNHVYPALSYSSSYSTLNKSYYGAHGQSINGRIFDGFTAISNPQHNGTTFSRAMDDHMSKTCTNAKAAGIQIYSIAFDVPNGSPVRQKLEQCASASAGGVKLYYVASDNASLIAAFENIAEKIAELAISK